MARDDAGVGEAMNEETTYNRLTWPLCDAVERYLHARQTGNDIELRFAEMRASYCEEQSIKRLEAIQFYHASARQAGEDKHQVIRELCEAERTIERLAKELEEVKRNRLLRVWSVE